MATNTPEQTVILNPRANYRALSADAVANPNGTKTGSVEPFELTDVPSVNNYSGTPMAANEALPVAANDRVGGQITNFRNVEAISTPLTAADFTADHLYAGDIIKRHGNIASAEEGYDEWLAEHFAKHATVEEDVEPEMEDKGSYLLLAGDDAEDPEIGAAGFRRHHHLPRISRLKEDKKPGDEDENGEKGEKSADENRADAEKSGTDKTDVDADKPVADKLTGEKAGIDLARGEKPSATGKIAEEGLKVAEVAVDAARMAKVTNAAVKVGTVVEEISVAARVGRAALAVGTVVGAVGLTAVAAVGAVTYGLVVGAVALTAAVVVGVGIGVTVALHNRGHSDSDSQKYGLESAAAAGKWMVNGFIDGIRDVPALAVDVAEGLWNVVKHPEKAVEAVKADVKEAAAIGDVVVTGLGNSEIRQKLGELVDNTLTGKGSDITGLMVTAAGDKNLMTKIDALGGKEPADTQSQIALNEASAFAPISPGAAIPNSPQPGEPSRRRQVAMNNDYQPILDH